MQPRFDVVISTLGDAETGEYQFDVEIIDRHHGQDNPAVLVERFDDPDDAIEWARGAVTAFMKGAKAHE